MFKMQKIVQIMITLVLVYMSYEDIKYKKVKILDVIIISVLSIICFIMQRKISLINIVVYIFIAVILFCIFYISKKSIGLADIVVLNMTMLTMSIYKTIWFVYLAFLLCGICSIVISLYKRKIKNISTAFLPYVTISFLTVQFLI